MTQKYMLSFILVSVLCFSSCADLFQNGDLSNLAEAARGDITVSDPSVAPSTFQKRVVTNLTLGIKATSAYEVVSVEADLSALGGGTVNLVKSGDLWSTSIYFRPENAGSLSVRFIARSKTGKIVTTNFGVTVITYGAVYVATNGSDTNEGLTSSNAVRSIQKGIDIAEEQGIYDVLVSAGSYPQSVNGICVNLKSGMSVWGGYDTAFGTRNPVSTPSAIDGLGTATHVVAAFAVQNSRLDGFVVRNANAVGDMGYEGSGAGILIVNSGLTLCGLVVSNNNSTNMGGGLFAYNSQLIVSNARFSGNASLKGGGLGLLGTTLSSSYTTLSGNVSPLKGGGIYAYQSALSMETNVFVSNLSVNDGGAIYSEIGSCTLTRCLFQYNQTTNAVRGGGAVMVNEGSLTVSDCSFYSNLSAQVGSWDVHGGGITILNCNGCTVSGSHFEGNICTNSGGGDYAGGGGIGVYRSSNITVQNCIFSRNIGYMGGAFCNSGLYGSGTSVYSLIDNRFYSNQTVGGGNSGGAVFDMFGVFTMNDNMLQGNSSGYGGGVYATAGQLTMNNNILSNNSAGNAGGIYVYSETFSITTNCFYHNTSGSSAGALSMSSGNFNVDRCLFVGNTAMLDFSGSGGAIYVYSSFNNSVTVNNSYFSSNGTTGCGGAVYAWSTNVNLLNSVFYDNVSAYGGGAVYLNSSSGNGQCVISGCTLTGNRTTNTGYGGGAAETYQGRLEMYNNILSYNYGDLGGAVKVGESSYSSLLLQGGTVSYHTNYAIYTNTNSCNISVSGVNFTGNYPGNIN